MTMTRHAYEMLTKAVLIAVVAMVATRAQAAEEFPRAWFWGEDAQREQHNQLVGKPMPELKLTNWQNSKALTREDLKGKIVVVDFWATWCGPCIVAIPKTNELLDKYADKGVVIVGVCGSSRGQEKMKETAAQHKIRYPIAQDASQESAAAWRVMWWPTYAVVDRKGNVRALGLKPAHVEAVVTKLIEEKTAATEENGTEVRRVSGPEQPAIPQG